MDIFTKFDDAFAQTAEDPGKLEEALGKARVNRMLTLPAAVMLLIAFLAMALTNTPRAEIFGVVALVNFAMFLRSDSDVKLLRVLQRLPLRKAGDAKPTKPEK